MQPQPNRSNVRRALAALAIGTLAITHACNDSDPARGQDFPDPRDLPAKFVHPKGDITMGQEVFRFETFGNQGFWTDAMQLPQGLAAANLTPLQALQLGLHVNFDALNQPTQAALGDALTMVNNGADPNTTAFGDPAVTLSMINQNAVIGVVTFDPAGVRKPTANSGSLDLGAGDKVGVSCALCHAITDDSILPASPALMTRGSVGRQVDGPTPHGLDVGQILAAANRTLAYYPMLQLQFDTLNNATIGRGFAGLSTNGTTTPTEADADAYLTGTDAQGNRFYPVGQFDAFPDGIGNPLHIAPLFRTDLSAPWGIDGGVAMLQDFNNTVFTVSLDPTTLLTTGGRAFLNAIAGGLGDEIAADYEQVLTSIGINVATETPYITAGDGLPPGTMLSTVGLRVDDTRLNNLNGYLDTLRAPPALPVNATLQSRGREIFRTLASSGGASCTECHQTDPNRFVPPNVIPMAGIYPGYDPALIAQRALPLSDIQNSGGVNPYFDDRMVVLDATRGGRGEVRGVALPLLLDLARRTSLLHDDSIQGTSFDEAADLLMDPARGPNGAHPFYVANSLDRRAVIEFLRGLQTLRPSLVRVDPPR